MKQNLLSEGDRLAISVGEFGALLSELRKDGREVVGPTVRDGAVILDEIHSVDELPWGWTDQQEAGRYRLVQQGSPECFAFAAPAYSWKRFLNPSGVRLWQSESADGLLFRDEPPRAPRYAFLGVRPCDLQAIRVQDRIFLEGPFPDPVYRSRREEALIIAVNCSQPGGTCFCVSMGNGPRAVEGFDLSLTEITGENDHRFLLEVGSEQGAQALRNLELSSATEAELESARAVTERAADRMGRRLDTANLKEDLYSSLDNPHWDQVAKRCLSCANCTMVCPTCFCTTVVDEPNLAGTESKRVRHWDSCFSLDFSYIHGGAIRPRTAARYRQWLTHKLASWNDQFGVSGCVGCGRCITWCPVGIDLTAEVQAIRDSADRPVGAKENADGKP